MATLRRAAFLNPGRNLAGGVELARLAEALGYESVWVTHGSGRDSFLVLAAYGAATTRLGLGNGVVPIFPRHPVAMSQAALTLAEMVPAERLEAGSLYPSVGALRQVSRVIAVRVVASLRGVGPEGYDAIVAEVDAAMWTPQYVAYKPV